MKKLYALLMATLVALPACSQDKSDFKEKTVYKDKNVEIHQIDAHTWHGCGNLMYNESIYLIEGSERALLLDAGTKMPGLRKIVEGIVKKPVTLVATHVHPDHTGVTVNEWDSLWINAADEVNVPSIMPDYKGVKCYLKDGQVFDLGGRQIEVVFTPGHTPGSTTFIDREAHYGFSGDAFGSGNLLVFTDLSTEVAASERLSRFVERYDIRYFYPGHYWGYNLETPKRVKDVGMICDGILKGTIKPNASGERASLPFIVDTLGVRINYGEAQLR